MLASHFPTVRIVQPLVCLKITCLHFFADIRQNDGLSTINSCLHVLYIRK